MKYFHRKCLMFNEICFRCHYPNQVRAKKCIIFKRHHNGNSARLFFPQFFLFFFVFIIFCFTLNINLISSWKWLNQTDIRQMGKMDFSNVFMNTYNIKINPRLYRSKSLKMIFYYFVNLCAVIFTAQQTLKNKWNKITLWWRYSIYFRKFFDNNSVQRVAVEKHWFIECNCILVEDKKKREWF